MNGKISEGINMEKKTERILQLYRMLYEGKAITKSDLAARFDVNEKTIQRDIEDIRAFLDNKSGGKWGGELRKHFSKERCSQTAMPFFAVFPLYFGLFLSPVQNQMHR